MIQFILTSLSKVKIFHSFLDISLGLSWTGTSKEDVLKLGIGSFIFYKVEYKIDPTTGLYDYIITEASRFSE